MKSLVSPLSPTFLHALLCPLSLSSPIPVFPFLRPARFDLTVFPKEALAPPASPSFQSRSPPGITAVDLKVVHVHREMSGMGLVGVLFFFFSFLFFFVLFFSAPVMKISQETRWVAVTFGEHCIFASLACCLVKMPGHPSHLTPLPAPAANAAQRLQYAEITCTPAFIIHNRLKKKGGQEG